MERKAWEPRCPVWMLRAVLAGPLHRSQQGYRRTQHCFGRKAASNVAGPEGAAKGLKLSRSAQSVWLARNNQLTKCNCANPYVAVITREINGFLPF